VQIYPKNNRYQKPNDRKEKDKITSSGSLMIYSSTFIVSRVCVALELSKLSEFDDWFPLIERKGRKETSSHDIIG
jgi:hypothetical protein